MAGGRGRYLGEDRARSGRAAHRQDGMSSLTEIASRDTSTSRHRFCGDTVASWRLCPGRSVEPESRNISDSRYWLPAPLRARSLALTGRGVAGRLRGDRLQGRDLQLACFHLGIFVPFRECRRALIMGAGVTALRSAVTIGNGTAVTEPSWDRFRFRSRILELSTFQVGSTKIGGNRQNGRCSGT
jgi:hypothetical protein